MTHDEHVHDLDSLPRGHLEIDALLDGEPVNKEALRVALDDVDARHYLVDALLLRQLASDMGPSRFVMRATPRGSLVRSVHWLAASVILIAGAGSGYMYGLRAQGPPAQSASMEVMLDNTPPEAAPQPTHVIRFEPGVNWTSSNRSR